MSRTRKEPDWPASLKGSFLELPTAGMRLAPQVLTLELMREVAYSTKGGATNASESKGVPLDPDSESGALSKAPRAVHAAVYALKGRAKQRKEQGSFFSPAYPEIAGFAWMRKNTDRVVRDFFLRGALAVGAGDDLTSISDVASETIRAIYGGEQGRPDVLALCAAQAAPPEPMDPPMAAVHALKDLLLNPPDWGLLPGDVISRRIARDWLALCKLEGSLPRLAWVELVGTFLRTVIPLWLLAQMRVCVIIRDFVRDALSGMDVSVEDVRERIKARHEGLLVPSTTLTDRIDEAVIEYMRARIELKVALSRMQEILPTGACGRRLSVEPGRGMLGLGELSGYLRQIQNRDGFWREVILSAESYPAWEKPLKEGQGKNIEEFLRVMRNDHVGGGDDGYLLERGPTNRKLFRVFPAPRVLALYVLLSQAEKARACRFGGRLLLSDLEQTFKEMGIDFTLLGGVRAELLRTLASAGILRGTPDAGEGAVLANPYASALSSLWKRA
jgi:hypothetical protein